MGCGLKLAGAGPEEGCADGVWSEAGWGGAWEGRNRPPGEQGPGGKVNQEEVGAWAGGSMGQTGCEEAGDPGPWMGSCGRGPGPASDHRGHTHDRKAGTAAGGELSPPFLGRAVRAGGPGRERCSGQRMPARQVSKSELVSTGLGQGGENVRWSAAW